MNEITALRSYNSKTFDLGNNQRRGEFHAGHIHYKDDQGTLQDVDYRFTDQGTYWELTKASYKLKIAKDFDALLLLRYENKFEDADHVINYEPHSLWWINLDNPSERQLFRSAQAVTGTLINDNTIRWVNAFGPGIHYQVQLQRSGFRKEIVAMGAPSNPPYTNYGIIILTKWIASGLAIKAEDQDLDWDGESYYETDQKFEVHQANGAKSYIRKAYARDSEDRTVNLKVFYERRSNVLWQGKLLTKNILEAAAYPIAADTTTSYYSGAGDGWIEHGISSSWDTMHDASAGDTADDSGVQIRTVTGDYPSAALVTRRGFIPIDTSGLPDGASISAATLYVYLVNTANGDNDGDDWITVVQTFAASTSALVVGDYDQCGDAVDNPTEGIDNGDRIDLTGLSIDQYYTFPLNSTGIGWIDDTGVTELGLREGHDVIDSPYAGSNNTYNRFRASSSEETGTSQDPYLSITYTVGAAAADSIPYITNRRKYKQQPILVR